MAFPIIDVNKIKPRQPTEPPKELTSPWLATPWEWAKKETPITEAHAKVLEYGAGALEKALTPFTIAGTSMGELEKYHEEEGYPVQGVFESAWDYQKRLEDWRQKYTAQGKQPPTHPFERPLSEQREMLPGGKLYEEYQQLPWQKQLHLEAPAWGAATLLPSATGIRAALAPVAARGGLRGGAAVAARTALAPVAGFEWATGKTLYYLFGKPIGAGIAKIKEAHVRRLWQKTNFYKGIKPEYRGTATEEDLYSAFKLWHKKTPESQATAKSVVERVLYSEYQAGRYARPPTAEPPVKPTAPLELPSGVKPAPPIKPIIPETMITPPPAVTGVPMTITKAMEGQLGKMGYSANAIAKMTPEEAWRILYKPAIPKAKGIRLQPTDDETLFVLLQDDQKIGEVIATPFRDQNVLNVHQIEMKVPDALTRDILREIEIQLKDVAGEYGLDYIQIQARSRNRDMFLKSGYELVPGSKNTVRKPLGAIGIPKAEMPEAVAPTVETRPPIEAKVTNDQLAEAHIIAKEKLLLDPKTNKPRPQYRRLAKAMTGKTSMAKMTGAEADDFIEALKRLEVKYGKTPRIPVRTGLITEEFADKIPLLKEIGKIDQVRPSRQVFEKMGLRKEIWEPAFEREVAIYEDLVAFRRELEPHKRVIGKPDSDIDKKIWRAIENPEEVKLLTAEERAIAEWGKKFFDKWADELKLPSDKRRKNYITHTFEAEISKMLKDKHPLDPELIKAMDYITPKTVFNPYLQQRLGQKAGLRESFLASIEAYEARALKVYHYEPLIQKIRVFMDYLPPNSRRYLGNYITRITSRPLPTDREMNQTLKEFAGAIEKLPGGKQLAENLTKGNAAGLLAYQYSSLLYFLWLGFKPTSAIRNLSQHALALADVGPVNFAKGISLRFTDEGKSAVAQSKVLRSRSQALLPGVDASFSSKWMDKVRETSLWMFRKADKQNVSDAFLAGYAEAKDLGLPKEWCIKRGDEVAADTQYIYSRLGGAAWSQSALGRVLSPLTTWPENWLELLNKWGRGKESYVYREYEAATGRAARPKMSQLQKRKALLIYLAIVGTAYAVEETTRLKATQYTGWTSMQYLVQMAKGQLPALDLPGSVAEVIGGALMGDATMVKRGWNRIRPDHLMGIVRQLENTAMGKTDWVSLFVYLNPETDPYQRIEDEVWSQYPGSIRRLSDKILELEKTDPREARRLLFENPQIGSQILEARRQIAIAKAELKRKEAIEEREKVIAGR